MSEQFPVALPVARWREHGFPITNAAQATAANLSLVPLGSGGLQYEMHAGGIDLEVLIRPDGTVESVYVETARTESNVDSTQEKA